MNSWICPNCHQPLETEAGALVCANRHSFDVAREGYVNLLTGRQKAGHKGDTPEMLAARRRFLEAGFYEPLRQRLAERVAAWVPQTVAEIGCGEGYYLGGVTEALPQVRCFGTDIAKAGVRLAAKRYPRAAWAVADTNRLVPLSDASADVLLDVFAPRNAAEFARVLRPTGHLLVVIPAPEHLAELRQIQPLLAIQADKRQAVETAMAGHFTLESAETITVPLRLDGATVAGLVAMTPNAWFLTDSQKQVLTSSTDLAVTAAFELLNLAPLKLAENRR
ncbi:MAG TPA: methyltransferase domain-containing protein [Candidatus Saccharimonadia bacterium]|nr:methyltransferase domain-containing protein [Candidatus Saccharimonadia bacterium]